MTNSEINKMSKQELGDVLNANLEVLKGTRNEELKNLKARIVYTGAHFAEAKKTDLLGLVKEAISLMGKKFVTPALAEEKTPEKSKKAENLVKKGSDKSAEKSAAKAADKASEAPIKKSSKKDNTPETLEETNPKITRLRAQNFPSEIEFDGEQYKICTNIKSMKDLHTAVEKDRDIVFAFYFPKRNLKQFGYFNRFLPYPKEFENDLDITTPIYVSEEDKVSYLISSYTEAMFILLPEDFEPVDGVKVAGAIEFEIYEHVTTPATGKSSKK